VQYSSAIWEHLYLQQANEERASQLTAKTRLHEAVKEVKTDKLKEILKADIDVNIQDKMGRTVVHFAAELGRNEHLSLLLKQKEVEIDAQDLERLTPASGRQVQA
jgi:ankyrin repeat protein